MKKLVYKHSKGPNVGLRAIDIFNESLRRHIDRRSNIDVFELAFRILGKPKIRQLCLAIVDEYVSDLHVSMHYVILGEVVQAPEYVFYIFLGLLLLQVFFIPEFALKISFVAQFGDDIAVSIAGKHLVAPEYIGMVELLQDFDLREEQLLELLAFEAVQLDDLDSHYLF